jgi:hypothetical protein
MLRYRLAACSEEQEIETEEWRPKEKSFLQNALYVTMCQGGRMTTLEQERTHPNISSPLRSCALVWVSI